MVTDASVIDIRDIKEISELRAAEDLQKEIWGCTDREILPSLTLIPLLEVGGVLLGAFAGEELIGFGLGFPGLEDGRPMLHSDISRQNFPIFRGWSASAKTTRQYPKNIRAPKEQSLRSLEQQTHLSRLPRSWHCVGEHRRALLSLMQLTPAW